MKSIASLLFAATLAVSALPSLAQHANGAASAPAEAAPAAAAPAPAKPDLNQGSTKFGVNYGGGVKVRMTDTLALRFDLRRYETPKPDFGLLKRDGWLHQTEVSAGVGFVF